MQVRAPASAGSSFLRPGFCLSLPLPQQTFCLAERLLARSTLSTPFLEVLGTLTRARAEHGWTCLCAGCGEGHWTPWRREGLLWRINSSGAGLPETQVPAEAG